MRNRSCWSNDALETFRHELRRFLKAELAPKAARWRANQIVDRDAWLALGALGALGPDVPEQYGGAGGTFAHIAVVLEELERTLPEIALGVTVHNAVVAQHILAFGTPEQKRRWLPELASGRLVGAIAMSEPGAGSDLQSVRTHARRDGDRYIVNGQKTFITNGQIAGLVLTAVRTDGPQSVRGISLLAVETEATPGFQRGRTLEKVGLPASDTSEVFFAEAVVPTGNLIGREGLGFAQLVELLPKERLALAIQAVSATERALEITIGYAKERCVSGRPVIEHQHNAIKLAERSTEALVARIFIDWCIERVVSGELDQVMAAMVKWWTTAKQVETLDACVQLHGGYGYMAEYEIARRFVDARAQTIYGGTNEVMKILISQVL